MGVSITKSTFTSHAAVEFITTNTFSLFQFLLDHFLSLSLSSGVILPRILLLIKVLFALVFQGPSSAGKEQEYHEI